MNATDSAAYDTLLIAQATIDQARTASETGRLPLGAAGALKTLIGSYNVARESWLTYRNAVTTKLPTDAYLDQLTRDLSDLTEAIRKLHEQLRMQARREAQARQRAASRKGAAINEKEAE